MANLLILMAVVKKIIYNDVIYWQILLFEST